MLPAMLLAAIGALVESRPLLERNACVVVPVRTEAAVPVRRRAVRHPYWEPARIDVAIGFTAGVVEQRGELAVRAFAQDAIDHTNEVLRRTGVYNVTVSPVWVGPLSFADVPNETPEHAMAWMRTAPEVASLRETKGADEVWLITFWTEPSAAPMPVTEADFVPSNGIAVMNIIGGLHSATHEFGHTLGLAHDFAPIEKPPANDPFPWRYAFYSTAGKFKDIMVPRYRCEDCEVWDAFSNAASWSTYRGFPTGGEKSDAARLIPLAASHVSAYSRSE